VPAGLALVILAGGALCGKGPMACPRFGVEAMIQRIRPTLARTARTVLAFKRLK
jgi:hypothetical protein